MAWIELTEHGSNTKVVVNTDHIVSYNVFKMRDAADSSNVQFTVAKQGLTGGSSYYRNFVEPPHVIEELLVLSGTAVRRPTP